MTKPTPAITIPVDLTNPGQFFACCGLLELASRLDDQALAWFDVDQFHIVHAPKDTIQQFLACAVTPISAESPADTDEDDEPEAEAGAIPKTTPILLGPPFNLRLDWWRDATATTQAKLKTWSAGQKVTDLFNGASTTTQSKRKGAVTTYTPGMRDHFRLTVEKNPSDWLRAAEPIESPRPFCYDSRLSRKNALDLGHLRTGTIAFSPAIDVLVHVGLQRFRPRMIEQWTRNLYCPWLEPLPVDMAAVATLGLIPEVVDLYFEFPIKPCDAKGRYKLFGHAQPVRRPHV